MIYFKRFLWLSAWSVWVWLGFGLYRELPRDSGTVVTSLQLEDSGDGIEAPEGFLHDSDEIVTTIASNARGVVIRLRSAVTGNVTREFKISDVDGPSFHISCRHGFVFHERPFSPAPDHVRFASFELRSGTVVKQSKAMLKFAGFHPALPLALTFDFGAAFEPRRFDRGSDPEQISEVARVEIINLCNGNSVFSWHGQPPRGALEQESRPFFSTDGKWVVIPTANAGKTAKPMDGIEIWNLDTRSQICSLPGFFATGSCCTSAVGRIACRPFALGDAVQVLEVPEGRVIFHQSTTPEEHQVTGGDWAWTRVALSSHGKTLLQRDTGVLWSVDQGTVIRRLQNSVDEQPVGDVFTVWDDWRDLPWTEIPLLSSRVSWRDLRTGTLIYRCREMLPLTEASLNASKNRIVEFHEDAAVRQFPPRPDWPLLFLCQTILALPLILLWAVLRWRRKRRAINTAPA